MTYWLFVLLLSGPATAATPVETELHIRQVQDLVPETVTPNQTPKFTPLAQRMAKLKVPGVSVAVIHDGQIEWARGFGVTRVDGPSVTEGTKFQAASISKPVFAVAVLHQVDAGKVKLDTDISESLKSWTLPESELTRTQKVTLRRLLSHTAGLNVHGFPGYEVGAALPNLLQILDGTPPANTDPIRVNLLPGSKHRYSGGGYVLAQLALSDVTGEIFSDLMRDTVLAPFGMTHSSFEQPLIPPRPGDDVAWPHRSNGKTVRGGPHIYPEMAAAGLWTTPSDLARFALGLRDALAGNSTVISATTARNMLTPVAGDAGMGIFVGGSTSRKLFAHNGGNEGYRCMLVAYEDGEGAVIMTNGDQGDELAGELMRTIAYVYDWPDYQPKVRLPSR